MADLPVRHFRTLEELGELVYRDWISIINNLYPPISTSIFRSADSEDYREWAAHEMFAKSRRKVGHFLHFLIINAFSISIQVIGLFIWCFKKKLVPVK